jgi:Peptidase family S41
MNRMLYEDGSNVTLSALLLLESQKIQIGCPNLTVRTIPKFLEHAESGRLSRREKETLVDQATLLIEHFYAHLPFKRARYATEPVQRFRLIHAQLDQLTDLQFHELMLQAFLRLRDAHTFYGLPLPYRGSFALLPFRMDCYEESGRKRFVVTNVLPGFEHARFGAGSEITLWQGMAVERAIEREAEQEPGGNPASRFARGLKRMTKRNLAFTVPPDEQSVVIQYIPAAGGSEQFSLVLPWYVLTECLTHAKRSGVRSSLNQSMAELKELSRILWQRDELIQQSGGAQTNDLTQRSRFPEVFEFQFSGTAEPPDSAAQLNLRDSANPNKKFGYIRIKSFEVDSKDDGDPDQFIAEFARILILMKDAAPDGLILDVRSNPGGSVEAAERILQLLTPMPIEPARFHFVNSRVNQQIAAALKESDQVLDANQREWRPWVDDLLGAVSSGLLVTGGKPLTNPDSANDTGQIYQGPVALIIDASSYSATDIFAAGFQDHGIGQVIGVDENTGGGGANRWLHEQLVEKLEQKVPAVSLRKLPKQAQMGLAIRRASRVGLGAGSVIEDEGVKRDIAYKTTLDDVLHHDRDLLRFACAQLGNQEVSNLRIVKAELLQPEGVSLTVETQNIYRVDCLLNGLQQCSFATVDGANTFTVPTAGLLDPPPALLSVKGFQKLTDSNGVSNLRMVARHQFEFATPDVQASAAAAAGST